MDFLERLMAMRRRIHPRTVGTPGRRGEIAPRQPDASSPGNPRRPLGDLLLERRLISPEQLHAALEQQGRQLAARKLLGEILIAMTRMSEEELLETLAVQARSRLGLEEVSGPVASGPVASGPVASVPAPSVPAASVQAAGPAPQAEAPSPEPSIEDLSQDLDLLARDLVEVAELDPEGIPEWIREFTSHARFPVPSQTQTQTQTQTQPQPPAPGPERDWESARSRVEEVALLQSEKLPQPPRHQSEPSTRFPMLQNTMPREREQPSPSGRILVAIGSRPEAIKLAPVIRELERRAASEGAPQRVLVCVTGAQQDLVEQELLSAGVRVDLNLPGHGQNPAQMLKEFTSVLEEFEPDWVMVQGDSDSSALASLAAQYAGVPVAHVEAGLDAVLGTGDEFQRRMIGLAAQVHFAPTERARHNLIREGVAPEEILVTGNTGIDTLRSREQGGSEPVSTASPVLMPVRVLVKASLRDHSEHESRQDRIAGLCSAVLNLVNRNPGRYLFLMPLDQDPLTNEVAATMLDGLDDVLLTGAASHDELLDYLVMSNIVLTDSASLQEEAASFGKPVLILREATERPEGVNAGLAWLIGTARKRIERAVEELAAQVAERRTLKSTANPYGDGLASARIADFFAGRPVAQFAAPEVAAESPLEMPPAPRRQPVAVA